jgi:manganese/zinc/iron transport system permease protein
LNEPVLPQREPFSLPELLKSRSWTAGKARALVGRAISAGHLEPAGADQWKLTESGLREAARVVRTHRLWETFLIAYADVAPDHVDRDADQIEHILAPDLIEELETRMRDEGRWPAGAQTLPPASPHAIAVRTAARGGQS